MVIKLPTQNIFPDIGHYWEVSNGNQSLYAIIVEKNPVMVRFFEPTNNPFEVLAEDLVRKVNEPQLIPVGRSRMNYIF